MDRMTSTQRSALTIAVLTSFLAPFLISGVNIALLAIEKEFDLDAVTLSWTNGKYDDATLALSLYFNGTHINDVDNSLFNSSIRLLFTISGLICLAGVYFSNKRRNLR